MADSSGPGPGVRHEIGIALLVWLALSLLGLAGAFQSIDLKLHDWRYRLRGPVHASPRIALVEIDDRTIAAYGSWPLPRETYALLIAALEQAGARAIGFDLLFLGANPESPVADRLLASVSGGENNIVHAISFLPADATLGGGDATPGESREALVKHGRPLTRQHLASAMRVSMPYGDLLESVDALGHTAVAVDRDGVVRRMPVYVRYGDWAYPALAIRVVETAARTDSTLPQFELAEDGIWMHRRGRARTRVPVDGEGATSIVFAGDRPSFEPVTSMLQALQWYRDADTSSLRRAFAGKLVLVGTTAVGEVATDVGATPYAEAAPLVFIHANAVNAAMRGWFLERPPAWIPILALAALAVLLGWVFAVLPLGPSAGVAAAAIAAVAVLDYGLFAFANVDLRPTVALLLPPLAWIGVEGYRRTVTERAARERERELEVARTIQRGLLPARPPDAPEFDVFGVNVPADAVGGDYYDWLPVGSSALAVVVGDVSGHGVPAALLMSHLRASFHAESRDGATPGAVVAAMHASLSRAVQPGRFATFFLALASRNDATLRYCNAGHNPPLLVRDGAIEALPATGLPLAMMDGVPWDEVTSEFRPGDTLVLYSDGVTECPYRQEMYGDERLHRLVLELAARGLTAADMGRAILEDVRTFAHGVLSADDVTLVIVRRLEAPPATSS